MKTLTLAACGLCAWLALTGPVHAQDDECRAVVAKAMKAMGGEDKLAANQGHYLKGKGTVSIMGMDLEYTAELWDQQPDKQKGVFEFAIMGQNFTLTQVYNGGKGWRNLMGKTMAVEDDELKEFKQTMNAERVAGLVDLKDKAYKLSSLGEVKVNGRAAVGILVARQDYRDVSLFFDKATHLLVKTETRAKDPNTMQEATQEKLFTDYKELAPGFQVPSKLVINFDGKKFLDMTISEARMVEKHDASIFAEP